MCATELFDIHASVLNRKTSLQHIHHETETKVLCFMFTSIKI